MDKFCENCGKPLSGKYQVKFCCKSCATTYHNRQRGITTKGKTMRCKCLKCGNEFDCSIHAPKNKRFCKECRTYIPPEERKRQLSLDEWYQKWASGEISGSHANGHYSLTVRRYLMNKYSNKCQLCGWGEVNPYSKTIPLEIHHIDGDYSNNRPENVQLLCPNCHSLTENFGALNKNCTRKRRYYIAR